MAFGSFVSLSLSLPRLSLPLHPPLRSLPLQLHPQHPHSLSGLVPGSKEAAVYSPKQKRSEDADNCSRQVFSLVQPPTCVQSSVSFILPENFLLA